MTMHELQQVIDAAYERRQELSSSTVDAQTKAAVEAAVAAGSTMVRLGTALFGERPAKQVSAPDGGEG